LCATAGNVSFNPGTDLPILFEETLNFRCAKLFSLARTGTVVCNSGMELPELSEVPGVSCV
jgi:hypothetical protein